MAELLLIYPPTHDPSMPYLAPFLLAGHVQAHVGIATKVVDLNAERLPEQWRASHPSADTTALDPADILATVRWQEAYRDLPEARLDGQHALTLRGTRAPFDSRRAHAVARGAQDGGALAALLEPFLASFDLGAAGLIGVSVGVEDQVVSAFTVCALLRRLAPDVPLVLGGQIVTRLHDRWSATELEDLYDFLVLGEGEVALAALARRFCAEDWHPAEAAEVGNVVRSGRTHYGALEVTTAPDRAAGPSGTRQLHQARPAWAAVDFSRYISPVPVAPVLASRRCYWAKCDFCSIFSAWDGGFRRRSAPDVVDELADLSRIGVRHVRFVDEDLPPRLMRAIAAEVQARNIDVVWEAYTRFEPMFVDEGVCDDLFAGGCRQLFFGLENIGPRTAALVNKGSWYTRENVTAVLDRTARAGIANHLFVLVGIPGAPIEEEQQTAQFVIEHLGVHSVAIGSYVVDRLSQIERDPLVRAKYMIELHDLGECTTELGFTDSHGAGPEAGQDRARSYIEQVYRARPDLAISALLPEETRFVLSSAAGNDYAQQAAAAYAEVDREALVALAIERETESRVERVVVG